MKQQVSLPGLAVPSHAHTTPTKDDAAAIPLLRAAEAGTGAPASNAVQQLGPADEATTQAAPTAQPEMAAPQDHTPAAAVAADNAAPIGMAEPVPQTGAYPAPDMRPGDNPSPQATAPATEYAFHSSIADVAADAMTPQPAGPADFADFIDFSGPAYPADTSTAQPAGTAEQTPSAGPAHEADTTTLAEEADTVAPADDPASAPFTYAVPATAPLADAAAPPVATHAEPHAAAHAAVEETDTARTTAEAAPTPVGMAEQDDWPPMSEMLQSFFIFEPTTAAPHPITVMGLDCARPRGLAGLAEAQRRLAEEADVICAGRMLLEEFSGRSLMTDGPDAEGEQTSTGTPALKARLLPLSTPLEPLLTRLSQLRAAGERVLVLADGDPLLFGIGATLVRRLGPDAVRQLPAVSSLQQACARLSLPWHKVICLSLHGRDDLRPLNVACGKNAPLCILTDARMSPDVLARHLLDRGVDWFDAHIFERMGAEDEAVSHLSMADAAGREFGPACTMVLIPAAPARRPHLGLDADQLAVDRGLITKKPVRAAALALLRIEAGHVVWDIGSGSGAVALEASVLAHEGRVIAVERSAGRAMGIQENRRRFGAANVDVRLGQAPECLPGLPDPQRVFIGGGLSGDDGDDILGHVCLRLPVGGRVVVSCVLLDSFSLCRRFFEDMAWPVEVMQISAAEGKTLGGDVHLSAMNPVFLLAAQKPAPAPIQSGAQPEGR